MPVPAQVASAYAKRTFHPKPVVELADVSASNYYATAIAGGEAGVNTGFLQAVLCKANAATFAAIQMLAQRMNNANQGHQFYATASGNLTASAADGGGTFRSSPVRTIAPSDVGKTHLYMLQHDGTFLRLWADRLQAGSGTALVGFTPYLDDHVLGQGYGMFANLLSPIAMLTARGVPSQVQLEGLTDAVRAYGNMPKNFPTSMPVIYGARIPGSGAAGNYLSTPNGVRGGHVSGVWIAVWATISSLIGDEAFISTTANSSGGYVLFRQGNRLAVGRRSSGAYDQVHTYTFKESDIGRRMLFGLSHDGTTLRGWCDGIEHGNLACAPIMAPTAAPMSIGTSWSGYPTQLISAPNFNAIGVVGGDGSVLTAGEWATLYADTTTNNAIATNAKATHRWDIRLAIASNGGVMPATVPDSIGSDTLTVTGSVVAAATGAAVTHRWSLIDALAEGVEDPESGLYVVPEIVDGQTAPATLVDTVTGAVPDIMSRVGTPKVKRTERRVHGRRRDGAMAFDNSAYYSTAANQGIRGSAAGFWFFLAPRIDALSEAYQGVCGAMHFNQISGWMLWFDGANMRLAVGNGGGATHTPSYSLTPVDRSKPLPILGRLNGTTLELWVRGVMVSSVTVPGTFTVASGVPMELGRVTLATPTTFNSSKLAHFGLMGGDVPITNGDVAAIFAEYELRGRVSNYGLVTQHVWDLSRDILASGNAADVPATVLDRVGSHPLVRRGGLALSSGGLTSFSTAGYPQSATAASGLPGIASAIWFEALVDVGATGTLQSIFSNTGTGATGCTLKLASNNVPYCLCYNGSSSFNAQGGAVLTSGQRYHIALVYNGSTAQLYVNGAASGAATGAFTLWPGDQPLKLGTLYAGSSEPLTTSALRGFAGGHSVPTAGEISAASTYALANGKVGGIAGKTLRLYSIVDDVIEAGGRVPAYIKDRSAGNHLAIVGSPLLVARQTERLYMIERNERGAAKTIASGVKNFTTTSVARTANGGGSAGTYHGGVWWAGLFKYLSTTGVSGSIIGKCGISTLNGYEFYMSGGTLLFVRVVGATDWINGPMLTLSSADIGKLMLIGGWIDPTSGLLRGFAKRAQIGGGVACTAYQPGTTRPFFVGGRTEATGGTIQNAVPNWACYGAMCGQGVPTLTEWQAAHDAAIADEEIVALPGAKTEHIWNFKRDYQEAGGMPTQFLDRIGTDHMTVAGTDLQLEHQYARLFAA